MRVARTYVQCVFSKEQYDRPEPTQHHQRRLSPIARRAPEQGLGLQRVRYGCPGRAGHVSRDEQQRANRQTFFMVGARFQRTTPGTSTRESGLKSEDLRI